MKNKFLIKILVCLSVLGLMSLTACSNVLTENSYESIEESPEETTEEATEDIVDEYEDSTETTTDSTADIEASYENTGAEEMPELSDEDFETYIETSVDATLLDLHFKNSYRLDEHYEKHGIEMGFESAEEYEEAAASVVANPDALHKLEAEDGDDVYYLEETNEFVIVSTDGYIRTYFNPSAGIDYYNRQ